jgi:hypothetical protein
MEPGDKRSTLFTDNAEFAYVKDTTRPALTDNVERVASSSVSKPAIMPSRSTAPSAGPSTQIKEERVKVKKEKVKQEKVNGKRRAQPHEDERDPEQEDDGSQQNDPEDGNDREDESPRGNKRRRVNGRGESAVDDTGSQPGPSLPQSKTLPRGEDG